MFAPLCLLYAWLAMPGAMDVSAKGELAQESRVFFDDHNPHTEEFGLGWAARAEVLIKNKPYKAKIRAFARTDLFDKGRAVMILEEGWVEYRLKPFRLRLGFDLLNWSATEAFHPADVINSRNLDSDLENLDKIGEPMVLLAMRLGSGDLSAYFMPYPMSLILPSKQSRLNFLSTEVALGKTLLMNTQGELTHSRWQPQGAIRFTQSIGTADIGLHVVHHLNRHQPDIALNLRTMQPHLLLQTVTQTGLTYSQVLGGLIIKVEAAYRHFWRPKDTSMPLGPLLIYQNKNRNHAQIAVGLEYGLAHNKGGESTLLLEGQSIFGVNKKTRRDLDVFQRDVLLGYRFAFNDVQSREIFLGVIGDVTGAEEVMFFMTYRQRLTDTMTLATAFRFIHAPVSTQGLPSGLEAINDATHLRFTITRHF